MAWGKDEYITVFFIAVIIIVSVAFAVYLAQQSGIIHEDIKFRGAKLAASLFYREGSQLLS